MSSFKYIFAFCICLALVPMVQAQNDPLEGQDKLLLENDRLEDVIESDKPYLKIPIQEIPEPDLSGITFESQDLYVETDFEPAPPSPRVILPEDLSADYNNLVKAGLGRYVTPLVQLYLSGSKEDLDYGLDFNHLSAHNDVIQYRNFREDFGNLRGTYLFNDHELSGRLGIYNTQYFNYADTVTRESVEALEDTIRMSYTQFDIGGSLKNVYDADRDFNYDLGLDFQIYTDRRKNREAHIFLSPNGSYQIADGLKLGLTSQLVTSNAKIDTSNQTRIFLDLTPVLIYSIDKFQFLGGVRLNAYNNSADESGTGAIVPQLEARYKALPEELHFFAGLTGGMTYNRYNDMIRVNPYLSSQVQITPTVEKYNVYAGLSGQLSQRTDYNAKVFYRQVENALIYLIPEDGAYFTVGYDSAMSHFGFVAEMNYDLLSNLQAGARLEYNNYTTSTFAKNFHATPITLEVNGSYTVKKKFTLNAALNVFGNTPMTLDSLDQVIERPVFVDLNLGAEYHLIDRLTVWAEVNNLLGGNYQRWFNYPERRLDFKAGVAFAF